MNDIVHTRTPNWPTVQFFYLNSYWHGRSHRYGWAVIPPYFRHWSQLHWFRSAGSGQLHEYWTQRLAFTHW